MRARAERSIDVSIRSPRIDESALMFHYVPPSRIGIFASSQQIIVE